jgi:hypothetical protein
VNHHDIARHVPWPGGPGRPPLDALLARGAVAGLVAGQVFILVNMFAAQSAGKPPVAPFLAISTLFRFSDMPIMEPAAAVPAELIIGMNVHLLLSALFGLAFAFIAPLLRSSWLLVAGGLVYGLLLYVINFQVVARLFFPWFVDPRGPNQIVELIVHPLAYGLLLVPFFLSVVGRGAETVQGSQLGDTPQDARR